MEFSNDWQFPPDLFYQQYQPGQMGYRASNNAYFQNSTRIAKPSKKHISPRGSQKRKLHSVPVLPTRTRSFVDRRPTLRQAQDDYSQPQTRPLSWHPISTDEYSDFNPQSNLTPTNYLTAAFTTAEVNGVVTPLSLPFVDEPQIHDMTTPLDELSGNDLVSYYQVWNDFSLAQNPYWPTQGNEKMNSTIPSYHAHDGFATDYNSMYNRFNAATIATAPASPNFLPIQSNNDETDSAQLSKLLTTTSNGEELVGMGLYDSPAEVQSSMLGLGGRSHLGQRGLMSTGLKLEDAFEPPEAEADDEDEDEQEEEEESAGPEDEDEEPPEQQLPLQGLPYSQPQFLHNERNLANQTFYFDSDYTSENPATFADPSYSLGNWDTSQHNSYGWVGDDL